MYLSISYTIPLCIIEAYRASGSERPKRIMGNSVSTNAAINSRALMKEVCRTATWLSVSTFIHHYKIQSFFSVDADFERILQHMVLYDEQDVDPPMSRDTAHETPIKMSSASEGEQPTGQLPLSVILL